MRYCLTQQKSRGLRHRPIATILAMLFCATFGGTAVAKPAPKYLAAVKQEIARLGYRAKCLETEGRCTVSTDAKSGNDGSANVPRAIDVIVDDESATVRFIIEDFLPATELSAEKARALLVANHELMVAKISVDDKTNAIVLSAVVNTDSNFDRKTFRSVFKGFVKVADALATRFGAEEDQN